MSQERTILLFRFPRDITRHVFDLLSVSDLLQLYCTGSSAVTAFIESSFTGELNFKSHIVHMIGTLPKLATSCRAITGFSIRTLQELAEFPMATFLTIRALPTTLVSLNLKTSEAECMLQETDEQRLEALYQLHLASSPQANRELRPRMTNLADLFPNLESLAVEGKKSVFKAFELFVLPPRLTSLVWPRSSKIDIDIFKHLPRSLRALEIGSGVQLDAYEFDPSSPLFPPDLERLHWSYYGKHRMGKDARHWSDDVIKALPKSLTDLSIICYADIPMSWVAQLPKSLTLFTINQDMDLEHVPVLPPLLTHIDYLTCQDRLSLPRLPLVLPTTLVSLVLSLDNIPLADIDLACLPTTLIMLEIMAGGGFAGGRAIASSLPPNLTGLFIDAEVSLEGTWPAGLTHLEVSGPSNYQQEPLALPPSLLVLATEDLKDRDLKSLPPRLTSLKVAELPSNFESLPPRLTALTFESTVKVTGGMINSLPRSLRVFEATGQSEFEFCLEEPQCAWPPGLKTLSLPRYTHEISEKYLDALPIELCSFNIGSRIPGDILYKLPRTLLYLTCGGVSDRFAQNLVDLPPQLTYLKVKSGSFDSKLLHHLPSGLQRLFLPEVILRQDHFYLLPLTIIELDLPYHHHESEDHSMFSPHDYQTRERKSIAPPRPPPNVHKQPKRPKSQSEINQSDDSRHKTACNVS